MRCLKEVDHVVTIADVMKEYIVGRGVPAEKVTVVPNAVDPASMRPMARDPALAARWGIRDDELVVGYVSTFHGYEGIHYLVEAIGLLRGRGMRVKGLLVGDGRERDRLERLAAELGIEDDVVFTGRVAHDEVPSYYALIDVFVVPRTDEATTQLVTPLKPFEAMAAGRTVVVSDTRALSEIVADRETGRVFAPEDPQALAGVIQELSEDPAERRRLADAGREWVCTRRTWALNAERYRELYERLGVS
jgi:glycosyltransferase involved in cell wall biosynthesis